MRSQREAAFLLDIIVVVAGLFLDDKGDCIG